MPKYCLTKTFADNLQKAMLDLKINPGDLVNMSAEQRRGL